MSEGAAGRRRAGSGASSGLLNVELRRGKRRIGRLDCGLRRLQGRRHDGRPFSTMMYQDISRIDS